MFDTTVLEVMVVDPLNALCTMLKEPTPYAIGCFIGTAIIPAAIYAVGYVLYRKTTAKLPPRGGCR